MELSWEGEEEWGREDRFLIPRAWHEYATAFYTCPLSWKGVLLKSKKWEGGKNQLGEGKLPHWQCKFDYSWVSCYLPQKFFDANLEKWRSGLGHIVLALVLFNRKMPSFSKILVSKLQYQKSTILKLFDICQVCQIQILTMSIGMIGLSKDIREIWLRNCSFDFLHVDVGEKWPL